MKHPLSFIEFHSPLFSQGVNLGNKVNVIQRGAQAVWDDVAGVVWLYFKGKASCLPVTSALSWDMIVIPDDMKEYFGIETASETVSGPPFARTRGRPPKAQEEAATNYDSSDESPEAHRARVRAASANSNRVDPALAQSDNLIQEARNHALASKFQGAAPSRAQVSTPQTPAVTGKPKAISHAGMKAQVAAEMKEGS